MWPFKSSVCIIRKEREIPKMWDFEARCVKCTRPLRMILTHLGGREIKLTPEECIMHPKDSHILWPQREDIVTVHPEFDSEEGN